jgi:translation elongation factor EF-1beta
MSKATILFKVYPSDPDKVPQTMDSIKAAMNPSGMQAQEVAFGIKLIKVLFVYDPKQTGSSQLEEQLKKVPGVSEIEVEEESLM